MDAGVGAASDVVFFCMPTALNVEAALFGPDGVAETLKDRESRGRIVKEWVATGDNHFHDCRIYALALFDHLGGNHWTADQWKAVAQKRGVRDAEQNDLFARRPAPVAAEPDKIEPETRVATEIRKTLVSRRRGGFVNGWKG